ncbi:MarR family transcriptional regulator [Schumannella luteola]|nr:MarR family transcriptional regulator [Schumannella luteola]
MTAAREKLQISQQDARALEYIALNPGVRPGVLREYLGITSAGVTTLTDRLVRRGVVSREADENDRRATHLTASIDLDVEPWSTLTAIDRELEQAIVDSDAHDVAAATDLLERLLGALGR